MSFKEVFAVQDQWPFLYEQANVKYNNGTVKK